MSEKNENVEQEVTEEIKKMQKGSDSLLHLCYYV